MDVLGVCPLISGVFQRLIAKVSPRLTPSPEVVLDVGRLLLKTVLSAPHVDVALVGMRGPRPRGTRFVELNNEISDDVASRTNLAALHDRYVR